MPTLETVSQYITDVRTLLQDQTSPFRYQDSELVTALNVSLLRARELRPDLFVFRHHGDVPSFSSNDDSPVHIEPPFRLAFVYGIGAHALARDQEDVQDARSSSFMQIFETMLIGLQTPPLQGATPNRQAK